MKKNSRQDAIERFPALPLRKYNKLNGEYDLYYPKTIANYVLTLPSKSYRGHIKMLGTELAILTKRLGMGHLIFMGDLDVPWLYRDHDFKHAKTALQFLVDKKIGKRFNGALQIDRNKLPAFTIHLAWLVRTNAVLPYIHFTEPEQSFIAEVCQYGNLHFYSITKKADKDIKAAFSESKFELMTDMSCYNKFSKNSAIKGRKIKV